jgi:hypothetical protein
MAEAWPWALIVIGGPVILGLAMAWSKLRNRRVSNAVDPNTPSDDPSKGM